MADGTIGGLTGPWLWLRWRTLRSGQGEGTTLVVLTAHTLTVVEGVGWVPVLLQGNLSVPVLPDWWRGLTLMWRRVL